MARKRLGEGVNAAALEEPQPTAPTEARGGRSVDFSAAEREAILRCCVDYRNRMPTYLRSVQRELKVIDSVIEKCRASPKRG